MKGLISAIINKSLKKGKSLLVVQRFLNIKYKIHVSLDALKKRVYYEKN